MARLNLNHLEIHWPILLGCFAGIIIVSAFLEFCFLSLENALHDHVHYLYMTRRIFKELSILGVITIMLMIIAEYSSLSKSQFETIEFAHLLLFVAEITYFFQAIGTMVLVKRVKERWDWCFHLGFERILKRYDEHIANMNPFWKMVACVCGKRMYQETMMELWIFRAYFISTHHLPKDFDFSKYLRRSLSSRIVGEIDIAWQSWLSMLAFIFVGLAAMKFGKDDEVKPIDTDLALFVCVLLSAGLLVVVFVISFILERDRDSLLTLSGCPDYDKLREIAIRKAEWQENADIETPQKVSDPEVLKISDVVSSASEKSAAQQELIKKVFILTGPSLLLYMYRLCLLVQCFVVGFTFLLAVSPNASIGNGKKGVISIVFIFIFHIIIFCYIVPKLIRNWHVLEAICWVGDDELEIIEDILREQQRTHKLLHQLSIVIYNTIVAQYDQGERNILKVLQILFNQLEDSSDKRSPRTPRITGKALFKSFSKSPYNLLMSKREVRALLRIMGVPGGISFRKFVVISEHCLSYLYLVDWNTLRNDVIFPEVRLLLRSLSRHFIDLPEIKPLGWIEEKEPILMVHTNPARSHETGKTKNRNVFYALRNNGDKIDENT